MLKLIVFNYLDAGTGSIIVQSIVGVAAGIAVFGRRMLSGVGHKVRSLTGRSGSRQTVDKT